MDEQVTASLVCGDENRKRGAFERTGTASCMAATGTRKGGTFAGKALQVEFAMIGKRMAVDWNWRWLHKGSTASRMNRKKTETRSRSEAGNRGWQNESMIHVENWKRSWAGQGKPMPPAKRARTAKKDGQERPIARLLVRPWPMEETTNRDAPSGQDG